MTTEARLLSDRLRFLSDHPVGLKEALEIVDKLPRIIAILDLVAYPESLTGCLHPGKEPNSCQYEGQCLSVSCDHHGKTWHGPRMTLEAADAGDFVSEGDDVSELKKGDRVTVHMPPLVSFHGVIAGEGRTGEWWIIIKDGTKYPRSIHKSYCQPQYVPEGPLS